jgi:hypothetical protein
MPQPTTSPAPAYQCRHIFTDGHRCGSCSLRGEQFCYYHHTTRRPVAADSHRLSESRPDREAAFHLPFPEDRAAIQQSIGELIQRLASNAIDPRRAGLILYALQIAGSNLPKPDKSAATPTDTVSEIVQDPDLGTLAPAHEFEPPPPSRPTTASSNTAGRQAARDAALAASNDLAHSLMSDWNRLRAEEEAALAAGTLVPPPPLPSVESFMLPSVRAVAAPPPCVSSSTPLARPVLRRRSHRRRTPVCHRRLAAPSRIAKPVAHGTGCQDVRGFRGVVLDLFPQLVHDHAEVFSFLSVARPPDTGQKLIMSHRPSGMLHQDTQRFVLFRRKVYLISTLLDTPAIRVEYDVTHDQRCIRLHGRDAAAANGAPDSRGQLSKLKGLRNVIGGSGIQGLDDVVLIVANGQHDNRQPGKVVRDPPARFLAAHAGHVDVQKNRVVIDHPQSHQRILAVVRVAHREPQCPQGLEQALPDARVIFND